MRSKFIDTICCDKITKKSKNGSVKLRMNYIDRIKKLKSEKKITNDRLSEMTGIPLGTLSKILAGMNDSPKLSNVSSLSK